MRFALLVLLADVSRTWSAPPSCGGPCGDNSWTRDGLRKHLLQSLDSAVPPTAPAPGVGVKIGLQLRIFKVIEVNLASGRFVLKVWRRVQWTDPRLAYNSTAWGGLSEIVVFPYRRGGEGHYVDNNMWLPDITLYNSVRTLDETMETGAAWVYPSGYVWYAAPGVVELACRFTGLVQFPRDTLSCPLEFGSWSYSDKQANITLLSGGVEFSASSTSTGTTYQEYRLQKAEAWTTTRTYPCCGTTPYTQVNIKIWVKRMSAYYFTTIELPGIILVLLSFLVFWLDVTQVGERLGFGATMLLGIQLLMTIVAETTPLCGEMMWIEIFNWVNFLFCCVCILESVLVVYVAFGGIGTVDEKNAEKIDYWARRFVPTLYLCAMGLTYSVTLDDMYAENWRDPMYQGFAPKASVEPVTATIVPIAIVAIGILKLLADKLCKKQEKQLEAAVGGTVHTLTRMTSMVGMHTPDYLRDEPSAKEGDDNGGEKDERVLMKELLQQMQILTRAQIEREMGHTTHHKGASSLGAKLTRTRTRVKKAARHPHEHERGASTDSKEDSSPEGDSEVDRSFQQGWLKSEIKKHPSLNIQIGS